MTSVFVGVVFEVDGCVLDGTADVMVKVEGVCVDEEGGVVVDENVVGAVEGIVVVSK